MLAHFKIRNVITVYLHVKSDCLWGVWITMGVIRIELLDSSPISL